MLNQINVRLDTDQLKHQHPTCPIGDRTTGHGNTFVHTCTGAWHIANTLPHMAAWAAGVANLVEREKVMHGQGEPVDGIHYEGFCVMVKATIYVLFHCYPASGTGLHFQGGTAALKQNLKAIKKEEKKEQEKQKKQQPKKKSNK